MYELSKAEKVARYLKTIPNLTTNKVVQYCWDNNLCSSDIQFVKPLNIIAYEEKYTSFFSFVSHDCYWCKSRW